MSLLMISHGTGRDGAFRVPLGPGTNTDPSWMPKEISDDAPGKSYSYFTATSNKGKTSQSRAWIHSFSMTAKQPER